jgi:hypothetical protein
MIKQDLSIETFFKRMLKSQFSDGNQCVNVAQGGVLGAWKLISIERVSSDGQKSTSLWMGKNPVGLIIYHPAGYMSVQMMRDPRPTFASGDFAKATPEEIKNAYQGYYAYFGTYEVNEKEGFVIHHIKGSMLPIEVGIDYKRTFKISGDRITLTTPPVKSPFDGLMYTLDLTWERVK